jgi:hypothetical protein
MVLIFLPRKCFRSWVLESRVLRRELCMLMLRRKALLTFFVKEWVRAMHSSETEVLLFLLVVHIDCKTRCVFVTGKSSSTVRKRKRI